MSEWANWINALSIVFLCIFLSFVFDMKNYGSVRRRASPDTGLEISHTVILFKTFRAEQKQVLG